MEKKDPIKEAHRYVANAEEVIQKANYDPELKSYTDSKYIKAAGDSPYPPLVPTVRLRKSRLPR